MKRHRYRILVALSLAVVVAWMLWPRSPASAQAGPKPGPDPYGFSVRFDAELAKIGEITPPEFAALYPTPDYLAKLTWDPTTAKFFDKLNVEKIIKPAHEVKSEGRSYTAPAVELSGYKLDESELAKYRGNGFVVSERLGGYSFGQVYYDVYTRDLPVFITSDSILHAWHRSYDAMLAELELCYLKPTLTAMLRTMHEALPLAKAEYGDGALNESLVDADYFLTAALSLMHEPAKSKFGQDDRVRTMLAAVQNLGMHSFKLFGRDREMDFSQFKVRGHYEAIPELRPYFQCMMWCGRTDLRVAGGFDKTGPLSSNRELGSAMVLLDLLRRAGQEEAWRKFDHLLQTFVGRTDSATFDDLARVAAAGNITSLANLKTEDDLQKLSDVILKSDAGKQDIRGDVYVSPSPSVKVQLPRSFTVMGQKFVVDSFVTAKTVFDDVRWKDAPVIRRVPSALDVSFAALANNHVVPDLVERIETGEHRFRDRKNYQHNLAAVRNVIDAMPAKMWDETIYTSWLKTLRTLSEPPDAKSPEVIRNRPWAMKQTNTQLASWTQLRHDTILYVKQSYTETASCYYPAGYVEPVVPFWIQMEAMTKRAGDLLAATPFPQQHQAKQQKQITFFRNFEQQMTRLRVVAEKQRDQKELDAEERKVLEDVMQIVHIRGSGGDTYYNGWYPKLFYKSTKDCVKWDALVADMHTDVPCDRHDDPGCVLHQGVGGVDLMLIAIDDGKDRVVYAGPTMSHYEFEMPGVARKSDAEWKKDLLDGKHPPRPDWTRSYLVPTVNRKPVEERVRRALMAE